jgi:ribonuclease HII
MNIEGETVMDNTVSNNNTTTKPRKRSPQEPLTLVYNPDSKYEICLDEVGRGPLFGRLYVAAVVLPRNGLFDGKDIKDSKKFSSKKKIKEVAAYIRENCLAYHIHYIEANVIDDINILQAVYRAMHECIRAIITKLGTHEGLSIIVDGDRFKPYCVFDNVSQTMIEIPSTTIEQGDAKYMGIAAASIIAKVAHDEYISELCGEYPELNERYGLEKNVGYGTKQHLDGILKYGISQWHRKSYGRCNTAEVNMIMK